MAKKKFDRIKVLKKISRESEKPYGKAGVHVDKKDRRIKKKNTKDYLEEEKDEEDCSKEGEND